MTLQVQDNAAFIALIRVAQDDPAIRDQLVPILRLPQEHREPAIRTFCNDMVLQKKPQAFIDAISYLADDAVAARVLAVLSPPSDAMPSNPVLRIIKGVLSALIGGLTVCGMMAALLLCVDACVIRVGALTGVIILMVALVSGCVIGMMSLARASWYWIAACVGLYGCIVWIIRATVL